ncbi:MAG TPA: TetR/AcrR family transcriptional regulator [Actinopolymorphaceae bacterium]|jgi:AcrR family transcriptional regulator
MDVHTASVLSASARPAQADGTAVATLVPVLDTAAAVLAKDPAASLGQVAAAAGIGRTTLHKQFPTRLDLLVAVASRGLDIIESVTAAAHDDPEPLRRLVVDLLPFGAHMTLLMQQPEVFADDAVTTRTDAIAAPIAAIVASAGTVRPGVPDWWLVRSLHSLLFTAWDLVRMGWLAPRDAPDLVLSTFTGGVLTS